MDLQVGQIVRSRRGRDNGVYYAVAALAGDRVLLANGRERRIGDAKVKNPRHLAPTAKNVPKEAFGSDRLLAEAIRSATGQPCSAGGQESSEGLRAGTDPGRGDRVPKQEV